MAFVPIMVLGMVCMPGMCVVVRELVPAVRHMPMRVRAAQPHGQHDQAEQ